ncbi:MAG: 2-octaprenyl-6-methoxyphenyl hydroxylase [Burkholderiales bacterium RIFCSPLOWO2_02_FULL_57_36]|nr:MAG: 2-octaprenyl-6-methoxyphenyl hydroxylase [Burkholderiales bacterium RIFCSPLOWO2_02_FULL_57_36]
MTNDFDIAICGAGPVGMALAVLLAQRGAAPQRIVLIDGKSVSETATDPRSIALSYGSRQILEQVGAWPTITDPIRQIHVSRRGHFGRTLIDCDEYGLPALGYVARYGALVTALAAALDKTGIVSLRPARITASNELADTVTLQLEDGRAIGARILVQAEGGVFDDQAARSLHRDYQQTAVIAQVTADAPIPHRAFERFTDEGPLALLPQGAGYALVWCMRPATAARISGLPDAAFLAELQQAFGTRLGRFTGVSRRTAYQLGLNAHPALSARAVAIGNAAQTLHPVAGQGLNLGLRDAAVLARLLARDAEPAMLERYAQIRHADRSATIRLTDTMARIFSSTPEGALSQTVLGLSLGLIDAFKPAKQLLTEQMMFGRR